MEKIQAIPANAVPQLILIISRQTSRQTAIKALIRNLFPVTPVFTSKNFPEAGQFLISRFDSNVLMIIDGWLSEDGAFAGRDPLFNDENTKTDFPKLRCLYLVDNPGGISIQQNDRILGGDITSNQFIKTIREMYK